MSQHVVRRLRPYLFHGFRRVNATRTFAQVPCIRQEKSREVTHDYEKRVAQLEAHKPLSECYPRIDEDFKQAIEVSADPTQLSSKLSDASWVKRLADGLEKDGIIDEENGLKAPVTVAGRAEPVIKSWPAKTDSLRQDTVSQNSRLQTSLP